MTNHTPQHFATTLPNTVPEAERRSIQRAARKITVTDDGCWTIAGTRRDGGYTNVSIPGRPNQRGHRLFRAAADGQSVLDIPRDRIARHKCDVRACVNPDHLEWGTHADNMRDMHKRGRSRSAVYTARPETAERVPSMAPECVSLLDSITHEVGRHERAAIIRVLSDVTVTPNGCWVHASGAEHMAYGSTRIQGKSVGAHRLILAASTGRSITDVDPTEFALHACDNPPCVAPHHLRWGTAQQNAEDITRRQRRTNRQGDISRATLTHCAKGHRKGGANTRNPSKPGQKTVHCLVCNRVFSHINWQKRTNGIDIPEAEAFDYELRRIDGDRYEAARDALGHTNAQHDAYLAEHGITPKPKHAMKGARRSHCKRGHAMAGDNVETFTRPDGTEGRKCRTCSNERQRSRRQTA